MSYRHSWRWYDNGKVSLYASSFDFQNNSIYLLCYEILVSWILHKTKSYSSIEWRFYVRLPRIALKLFQRPRATKHWCYIFSTNCTFARSSLSNLKIDYDVFAEIVSILLNNSAIWNIKPKSETQRTRINFIGYFLSIAKTEFSDHSLNFLYTVMFRFLILRQNIRIRRVNESEPSWPFNRPFNSQLLRSIVGNEHILQTCCGTLACGSNCCLFEFKLEIHTTWVLLSKQEITVERFAEGRCYLETFPLDAICLLVTSYISLIQGCSKMFSQVVGTIKWNEDTFEFQ